MEKNDALQQLVDMSCALGVPERDYVILGEGNTSARADEKTYYIKASGFNLNGIGPSGFIEMSFEPVLALMDKTGLADTEITRLLMAARVDPSGTLRPSVESTMHALIYALTDANFIGHTHPTAVNSVLCSQDCEKVINGRLFPDHIVFCGVAPAYVPYTEFGLPLARAVRRSLEAYLDQYGIPPKSILMQNHGLIAVGRTASEVESITAMNVKSARVLLATAAFGGPRFLTDEDVNRIYTHPGEAYRRKQAGF
ncbi:MAG: class II aldolase [Anaerolineaceae bacterium]|nr:class II aldolase [Anaerolineaceae bacterium]